MNEKLGNRDYKFWLIQIPGWLLLVYLFIAQGVSAFSYELGVVMGTQEPAEKITGVGTAFWYGFAFGDLVFYIPVLLAGLVGEMLNKRWGRVSLTAAFGITVYWPIVSLASIVAARDAYGWDLSNEVQYWIVLPVITAWGVWGFVYTLRTKQSSSID